MTASAGCMPSSPSGRGNSAVNPFSLRNKFITGFCLLILLIVSAQFLFMRSQLNLYLSKELDKRGMSIARYLADDSITPVLTENGLALQLLVNESREREPDVAYIYVVNSRNEVIAHTFGDSFPADILKADHAGQEGIQLLESGDERLRDVAVKIQQGDLGRLHVGLSESMIDRDVSLVFLNALPYVAAMMCLGLLAALFVAATITRPLKQLQQSARMVGLGNLDWTIDIRTRDEIGELASTFNGMTAALRETIHGQKKVEEELGTKAAMLAKEAAEREKIQEQLSIKQQQLEELNMTLEERILHTLKEIRRKDEMLIEQNRFASMGEMLNNIAHQWRQPLNNVSLIIQHVQLTHDRGELTTESLAKEVKVAMEIIQYMSRTIDDFRNFFRQDKSKKTFSLNAAVSGAIEFMAPSLTQAGIGVELQMEPDDIEAFGYANEYSQVLLNIISNAKDIVREREPADPRICIRVFREADSSVVTLRDNCGGIEMGALPRIFDPYFTTRKISPGTGIGLYMSKTIIEQNMGGSLTARNVDGGAEFEIRLSSGP